MYNVAVLMSTYNGERFLKEQVDSVLKQEQVNVKLYVRDDNSQDKTKQILNQYGNRIEVFYGENLGVGNSFMDILYKSGLQYDYYAFCDQDDIWMPRKTIAAINKLKKLEGPGLYCSNQKLVDKDMNMLEMRHKKILDVSYMQILCNNQISGCTMVWNRNLQKILLTQNTRPSSELLNKRIHDVWVSMVASVKGMIIYDRDSFIYYRQHENNVVGAKIQTKKEIFKEQIKKLFGQKPKNGRSALAKEIVSLFPEVGEKYPLLEICAYPNKIRNKRKLIFARNEIISHTGESSLTFIFKVLFGFF